MTKLYKIDDNNTTFVVKTCYHFIDTDLIN